MTTDYFTLSHQAAELAQKVLAESGITEILLANGCRVNIVGSLAMNLMAKHRDIDLHFYSPHLTTDFSFKVMARIAENPAFTEIRCINGLHTDEHCIAWHLIYHTADGQDWQFDLIHIDSGSHYDGFFERMAQRISEVATPDQRHTIIKLKYETPPTMDIHGIEYYEGVIAHGITTIDQLWQWVQEHRLQPQNYWIP